jgi:hypothetical protein
MNDWYLLMQGNRGKPKEPMWSTQKSIFDKTRMKLYTRSHLGNLVPVPAYTSQPLCRSTHCNIYILYTDVTCSLSGRFCSRYWCISCNLSSCVSESYLVKHYPCVGHHALLQTIILRNMKQYVSFKFLLRQFFVCHDA